MKRLANHQFKIIGEKITFDDIPEDGQVTVGKKKKLWYDVYKFTEEQEEEWREWCKVEMMKHPLAVDGYTLEMVYGFVRKLDKEKGD